MIPGRLREIHWALPRPARIVGMKTSRVAIVSVAFVVAAIAAIVYSTMGLASVTLEVCITYKGRTDCRLASGATREEAIQTATTMACSSLASGVGESIACDNTQPDSVRLIES